jgi:hypothetical protein
VKLKFFTDLELLKVGDPVELLIPFIGVFNEEDKPGKMMSSRFNEYLLKGREFIELTTQIEEADACLLPVYYELIDDVATFENAIQAFIKTVESSGKKTIIFAGHDVSNPPIKVKNSIIFTSALSKSTQPANMFAWPHFFEDFLKQYYNGEQVLRDRQPIAAVGFCGYAPPLGIRFGKAKLIGVLKLIANYTGIIKKYPAQASHSYRARAILGLKNSKLIATNFKLKPTFAFGPLGQLNTGNTQESDEEFRKSFVSNIIESDYTLCVRGIGNNSVRFYESLCCGRIPVFVNTDCVLPFDFKIDWKSLCIWVEEKDIDNIDKIVFDYHNNITNQDFIELQKKLRLIWEEYFSPIGFFKQLHLFINN